MLRHAFAIQRGEINDPESGLPHAAHIMCCAAFIVELQKPRKKNCSFACKMTPEDFDIGA
jgi:hypothetical protein